jgi:hypothetical protein
VPGETNQSGFPAAGFGVGGKPDFWIGAEGKLEKPLHVALAKDRAAVDAFYQAALAAGGKDHGPPGLRPHYHPNYYASFVLDLDGHKVEAVCHAPRVRMTGPLDAQWVTDPMAQFTKCCI